MKYKVRSFLAILAVCSTSVDAGRFYLGASTGIMDTNVRVREKITPCFQLGLIS